MDTKAFWKSKTLQGLLITLIGITLPKYTTVINETAEMVIQGVGLLWAAYGKIKTTTKVGLTDKPAQ